MKQLLLLWCLAASTLGYACDICGCGVGTQYVGIQPGFSKRVVALRTQYRSITTHVGLGGSNTHLTAKEQFFTTEVLVAIPIGQRWRFMANLPVGIIGKTRVTSGEHVATNGLADASATVLREITNVNTTWQGKKLAVSGWLGAGIKAPTGKYTAANQANGFNSFQLGSGSWDALLQAMYDVRLNDWGINIASLYRINSANAHQYQFGNRTSVTMQAYKKIASSRLGTFSPNAGWLYEHAQADRNFQEKVLFSSGYIHHASIGLEWKRNHWLAGANIQIPLVQTVAQGFATAHSRAMFFVGFSF
ncbi:MAG: hypothetical protein EAY72_13425 [Bacteroidetes bacterium]|nr:MAG: hypothetical protein EAY72_13425 [Bacteroidota bacterium]